MSVFLHGLATAVPPHHHTQDRACAFMQEHATENRAVRRIIRSLYRNSGIEKRHSVVPDWEATGEASLFFEADGTRRPVPDTRLRNERYTREARVLYEGLARRLVQETPGFTAADVTHVITISCTGFFAPGPDIHVVRALGLPGSTQRYHVGFMGCYAAFQGLRMAEAFCRADPEAVVLVLAVELCTLHLQFTDDTDDLIAGSVFADGGSGALVSARAPATADGSADPPPLEILSFRTALTDGGEEDMAWTIGNRGFRMKLSTYVPDLIEANLAPVLGDALGAQGLALADVDRWAVHPGGRAILDKAEGVLELGAEGLAASRTVLRDYGNMSSATILFVLDELLRNGEPAEGERVCALAFGPGLTIELGLFQVAARQ
jgi:predicted naringenin-chalcone synthase